MTLSEAEPHLFQASLDLDGAGGHYEQVVPAAWEGQPGLVYGGFTLATVVRAAGLESATGRPASVMCQFLRPVAVEDPIRIDVTPVRRGRSSDLLHVSLIQSNRLAVDAQVRTTTATSGPEIPASPSRDLDEPLSFRNARELYAEDGWELIPNFMNHLEARVDWETEKSDCFAWSRFAEGLVFEDPFLEAARVSFLIDQQAPAVLNHLGFLRGPRRFELPWFFTNLDLFVHFHKAHGTDWLCYISNVTGGLDGVAAARTEAWSQEGELLATAHSQIAFFPTTGERVFG